MTYNISQIANILGVKLPSEHADRLIDTLLTDSRSLSKPESSLFFAIHTDSNDGHRYIRQLYDQGVRAFVVDYWNPQWRDMDADFLVAPQGVMAALQQLASYHRHRNLARRVVAIAGSRGKTTLKEWLFDLLTPELAVSRSPRSYNSQIGVPLSLWLIDKSTDVALIEAGISRPGEMERLARMIDPDIAILTNIHDDHSEAFASIEEKLREKAIILSGASTLIYCADSPLIGRIVGELPRVAGSTLAWTLTGAPEAQLQFSLTEDGAGATLTIRDCEGREALAPLPSADPAAVENACHAAAAMIAMGYDPATIAPRLGTLDSVNTRTEVIEGLRGSLIIRDRYLSDLDSLAPAIDFLKRRVSDDSLTAVVLDSLHHAKGLASDEAFRQLGEQLRQRNIGLLLAVGPEMRGHEAALREALGQRLLTFASARELVDAAAGGALDLSGHTILIKGRGPQLDAVAEALQARRHETVLEVNLDDLVANYNFYRRRLVNQETGIVCMVKASGYGAGSYELARTLQAQGAAYLAVAVLDEGVDLRRAGITMPIMVLNPRVVNYDQMFANHLEPEIFSFEELEAIVANARRHGITDYPVHIKLDTGMHRLGFVGEEMPRLIEMLKAQSSVRPVSVFSHLAAADDPAMDDYTLEQFARYDAWSDMLRQHWPSIKRHILNSTGITRFPEKQYDMVRLGICLYGIATMDDGSQEGLRPISSLRTSVIALRSWPEGTTIGYNRRGVCRRPTRVATIPVGYADGINRHLGNGGMRVSINGHRCPTIGNICMDACMIDVTDCADDVRVGDSVEIFGRDVPVTELSDALSTIPYEILTSVSERVKRVYYRE